jgi:hypothetical protein
VESRPRTNRRPLTDTQTPTDTAPPPGGSADLAGHRPRSSKGLTLAAESPRRETITPLRGDRDETGRAMTKASERRAGTTRQRLIRRRIIAYGAKGFICDPVMQILNRA